MRPEAPTSVRQPAVQDTGFTISERFSEIVTDLDDAEWISHGDAGAQLQSLSEQLSTYSQLVTEQASYVQMHAEKLLGLRAGVLGEPVPAQPMAQPQGGSHG
jgi:hypothetical protein